MEKMGEDRRVEVRIGDVVMGMDGRRWRRWVRIGGWRCGLVTWLWKDGCSVG
ncbi:hypothetical protein QJS04_geneDACA011874 [Acorus gramineus]|uniref:Uncharacterized protein n=1 Tax=Acorus gramineus TaxID=55184 RepID=A0AAV9AIY3_ACOGR|nr:hypothetical protein QJS04_geneDACA011874 [Acorus gramineus]